MSFLAPLSFLFAATLPVVVVFYLLKRKRQTRRVPSTLLWQKFLAETQASAPFQRLRHNWLLVLQLLLLLLAVLALARPYLASKSEGGRLLVVILDASASMQSDDEAPSRFENARREALKLVDGMGESDQMVVLVAGATTQVRQSPSGEKTSLRRAINEARATDSPTRLTEALKLAETLIQNSKKPEIHLFSDGAVGSLAEFGSRALPLSFHQRGLGQANVGIVNLDVRSNPENPSQRAVFTTLYNASTNQWATQVELLLDGVIVEVKSAVIPPRESLPMVFLANQAKDGVFKVRIPAKDELAADNEAQVVSLLPQPVKVLLVTAGNRFLEKALRAHPQAVVTTVASMPSDVGSFDFAIVDNVTPGAWPDINLLVFNQAPPGWFEGVGKVEAPPLVDWKGGHPLLRFVSFDTIQVAEALKVKLPSWGSSLVDTSDSPLAFEGQRNGRKVVWIGFDALASTWPLRVAFPIFVANVVDWLNPATERADALTVSSGEPFQLTFPPGTTSVEVTSPGGEKSLRALDPRRPSLVYGDTGQRGLYQVKTDAGQISFAVNLLDARESDTAPRKELNLGEFTRVEAAATMKSNLEIWRWLALAAFLVLSFEWWFFHRRTA